MIKSILRIAAVAAFLSGGLALTYTSATWAQGTAGASSSKSAMGAEEKKAKSKECSAKADEMKLHGKKRKEFRAKCKRGES